MPSPRFRRRRGLALAVAGVIALVLSGCVGAPAGTPSPSPSPSAEPVFASDEEALAAATKAYEAYRTASAEVARGAESSKIDSTVTPSFAETIHGEFEALRDAGLTMVGDVLVDRVRLAFVNPDDTGVTVSIYLCRDVSNVRVISADGSDVTPSDRDPVSPTQAFLKSSSQDPSVLLVDGVELWSGQDFC
ncbi:hypothetical protein [Agromyces sp. NPDC049794]|uniref:hypothetical protein n=1 Tax=unclassified Agromyces TaxID=2639701 RepID=UPI0033F5BBA0